MKSRKSSFIDRTILFLGSNRFFIIILVIFLIQAIWLALSAAYPMIYDEQFHFGLIREYSKHYSPFITSQTVDQTIAFGDITRSPSYLYHYILSFPYRIISHYFSSFMIQLVFMRIVNVSFVAVGIIFYRKLFLKFRINRAVINISLLLATLLPIFVYLSAHINYDNLLFMLMPVFLLYAAKLLQSDTISPKNLLGFISTGMVALLVKYTFIPIFIAVSTYVLTKLMWRNRIYVRGLKTKIDLRHTRYHLFTFRGLKKIIMILIFIVLPVSMVVERDMMNIVKYGNLVPSCESIQSFNDCMQNPVISMEYGIRQESMNRTISPELYNFENFTLSIWIPQIVDFTSRVGDNTNWGNQIENNGTSVTDYGVGSVVISHALTYSLFAMFLFVSFCWVKLKELPLFWLSIVAMLPYFLVILVYVNYMNYRNFGVPYAIQPRYLVIILPLIIIYFGQAINFAIKSRTIKIVIVSMALLVMTQGGGVSSYILSSDKDWYNQKGFIVNTNMIIRRSIEHYVLGSRY